MPSIVFRVQPSERAAREAILFIAFFTDQGATLPLLVRRRYDSPHLQQWWAIVYRVSQVYVLAHAGVDNRNSSQQMEDPEWYRKAQGHQGCWHLCGNAS